MDFLNTHMKECMQVAYESVVLEKHLQIEPIHILKAILENKTYLKKSMGIHDDLIGLAQKEAERIFKNLPQMVEGHPDAQPQVSHVLQRLFIVSKNLAKKYHKNR